MRHASAANHGAHYKPYFWSFMPLAQSKYVFLAINLIAICLVRA
jgi:hypothetical protein